VTISNLELLARRLEADIRARGLQPGDRYLTADEAGQMLSVSAVTAHRAMKLLSDRQILVRQRRAGTFVGKGVLRAAGARRKKVHLIVASDVGRDQEQALQFLSPDLLSGIAAALPGASVQLDVLPVSEGLGLVRELVTESLRDDAFAGAILVRSTLEMQRYFEREGIAAVIYGTPHPTVTKLGSLDLDQARIGELSAAYVRQRGYRRVQVLMFEHWAPGDNVFLTHFMRALSQPGGPQVRVDIASLASDEAVIVETVRPMLDVVHRPDVIVARAAALGQPVAALAMSMGLALPNEIDLLVANYRTVKLEGFTAPYVAAVMDDRERGRMLGEMLRQMQDGSELTEREKLIGVQFHLGVGSTV